MRPRKLPDGTIRPDPDAAAERVKRTMEEKRHPLKGECDLPLILDPEDRLTSIMQRSHGDHQEGPAMTDEDGGEKS